MKLSIDNLKESGAFVSRQPVMKEIEWSNSGEDYSAQVYVLPMSYKTAKSDLVAARGSVDEMANRIATHIVDEAGNQVFTVGDITGDSDPDRGPLNYDLTVALFTAIGEVSGMGKS